MEDLIYILAGVAYLTYSIYSAGQKKKKKQEQAAAQQSYAEPEVSESVEIEKPTSSIFDEILGTQNFDFRVEEELYENAEKEEILDVVPEKEGICTTGAQEKFEDKKETNETAVFLEEDSEEELSDFEFDLRDAVISSEILNPPYINR